MTMKQLRTFLLLVGLGISTLCSGQSALDDKICLFPEEIDYFLKQDLKAKALEKDTVEYRKIIALKSNDIKLLKENEESLKSMYNNQIIISDNYKADLVKARTDLSKYSDKLTRRGGIIIGSVSVNVLLILTVVLLVK